MSESVEQAARVAGWRARAEREAAAILAQAMQSTGTAYDYSMVLTLVGIGWLQGANFGAHDTLEHIDRAFRFEKAEL